MGITGEPDPKSASLEDWMAYRDRLRSMPANDETVRVSLAVANAQILKLQSVDHDRRRKAN
jgi:hypothetical protein